MIEVRSIDKNNETLYHIQCTETNMSEGFRTDLKGLELSFIRNLR